MHLSLCYIMFICHQDNVFENDLGSVYAGVYYSLSKIELGVFSKLYLVGFIVICKSSSGLL